MGFILPVLGHLMGIIRIFPEAGAGAAARTPPVLANLRTQLARHAAEVPHG